MREGVVVSLVDGRHALLDLHTAEKQLGIVGMQHAQPETPHLCQVRKIGLRPDVIARHFLAIDQAP